MAVKTMYIVERKEGEVMKTASKKEADAYDRMLDMADELYKLMKSSEIEIEDSVIDDLSVYLAKNKDTTSRLLKGQKLKKEDKADKKD